MKYLLEYKEIDFNDWNEEEYNFNNSTLLSYIISAIKYDFEEGVYDPYYELLKYVNDDIKNKFINNYYNNSHYFSDEIEDINDVIINITENILFLNKGLIDILDEFIEDIIINYRYNAIQFLPEHDIKKLNLDEDIDWGRIIGIGVLITIIPVALLFEILMLPYNITRVFYYKYFKKDWRLFARNIQRMMDLMLSYSKNIKKLEEYDNLNLDNKQKTLNKIKKLLLKKFGKLDITDDDIKDYAKKMFKKISNEDDKEFIYKIVDDYNIRELQLNDKNLLKKLRDIVNELNIDNELDPFGEEDWEEEENDQNSFEGKTFYYMVLKGLNNTHIGKGILNNYRDGYLIGNVEISKKEFNYSLNKYYKQYRKYGKKFQVFVNNGDKLKDILVIIPEDKRYLFVDIVKANWDMIKYLYKKYINNIKDDYVYLYRKERKKSAIIIQDGIGNGKIGPDKLVDLIDSGFDNLYPTVDANIDIFDGLSNMYMVGWTRMKINNLER